MQAALGQLGDKVAQQKTGVNTASVALYAHGRPWPSSLSTDTQPTHREAIKSQWAWLGRSAALGLLLLH